MEIDPLLLPGDGDPEPGLDRQAATSDPDPGPGGPAPGRGGGKASRQLPGAPDYSELQEWLDEGGCEATDGCWVEPDGHCPHGKPSWLLALGEI